jgi:hypothetical protein
VGAEETADHVIGGELREVLGGQRARAGDLTVAQQVDDLVVLTFASRLGHRQEDRTSR